MSKTPTKKRTVIFIVIFAIGAFLIVFFAQKRTEKSATVANEYNDTYIPATPQSTQENDDIVADDTASPRTVRSQSKQNLIVRDNENNTTTVIPGFAGDENASLKQKKVVKTGNIDMRVNSVENAISEIRAIAVAHGGDEVSSDFTRNDTYKSGYILVKVPVDQFEDTFAQIKAVAPLVVHESTQTEDITAQFIDLESRIKNKKQQEARLRALFKKADDVDDLIKVEQELARVRTQIEQMESQLKYLKNQTQYSTINTTLEEDANIVVSDTWRPAQVIKDSFNTLIQKTTNLTNSIIRFVITSLPFIILFILIVWFLYFTAKHIFDKNDKNKK